VAGLDDIAGLIQKGVDGPVGPEDSAFHTGTVVSWNRTTGANVISVNGVNLSNIRSLQSGIPNWYTAGDVVIIIRKQTQYFILGRVAAPGGTGGSGPVTVADNFNTVFDTANVWADNPSFPNSPQATVNIGSSRAAIVSYECEVYVRAGDPTFGPDVHNPLAEGGISFAVSGATTIAAGTYSEQAAYNRVEFWGWAAHQAVQTLVTVHGEFQMGPSLVGLNPGSNTFTMKYKTQGGTAQFINPHMSIVPL